MSWLRHSCLLNLVLNQFSTFLCQRDILRIDTKTTVENKDSTALACDVAIGTGLGL